MGRKKTKFTRPNKPHNKVVGGSRPADQMPPKPPTEPPPGPTIMEPTSTHEVDTRPTKRQKTSGGVDLTLAAPANNYDSNELELDNTTQQETTSWATTYRLPPEFEHLQNKFHFTTMSILSSSKIEQKVRNLLSRTQNSEMTDDGTKTGVVVLCAKGGSIAKLVSIVEIAKRTIAAEGGKWFEYTSLNGEITNMTEKKSKKIKAGKTIRQWEKGNADDQRAGAEGQQDVTMSEDPLRVTYEDDEEAAFQTMGRRQIMAYDKNPNKIRILPQMTTYMSRVPIAGLKSFFGFVILHQESMLEGLLD